MTVKPRVDLSKDTEVPSPEEDTGDLELPEVSEDAEEAPAYTEPDDEFGDDGYREESDIRGLGRDFVGGKGISGATDLTPAMAVLLTQWRVLMDNYPEKVFKLRLDSFPQWLEKYRLSIGRGSRKELTDIYRGNVQPPVAGNMGLPGEPPRGRF